MIWGLRRDRPREKRFSLFILLSACFLYFFALKRLIYVPSETLIRHAKYLVYSGGAVEMCAIIQQAGDYVGDRVGNKNFHDFAFAVYSKSHEKINFQAILRIHSRDFSNKLC